MLSRNPSASLLCGRITELLHRAHLGDALAADLVYRIALPRLLSRARSMLGQYRSHPTLEPSDLVHEGFARLGGFPVALASGDHFYRLFSRAMGQVLTDRSRRSAVRNRAVELIDSMCSRDVLLADEERGMLEDLVADYGLVDPMAARAIRLRYFEGYTWAETARILDKSISEVRTLVGYGLDWIKDRLL